MLSLPLIIIGLGGCSSSKSTTKPFEFASIAAIVNSALPSGLQATTTSSFQLRSQRLFAGLSEFLTTGNAFAAAATTSDTKTSIEGLFKGTYAKVSGGSGTGYINSNLEDLDTRISELESRFTTLPTCFSSTLSDYAVDFQNHADAKLTLKLQCRDEFTWKTGDSGSPGSGMAFGKRTKTDALSELISVMLLLKHKTSTANGGSDTYDAGFGYAGNMEGAGTTSEAVEMLFGQFNTNPTLSASDEDQPLMVRIYAKPTTKEFELAFTSIRPSSGSPLSGGSSALGCGFRMISNGTLIVVNGNYKRSGSDCTSPDTVSDICVDAITLADASSSSASGCAALAATQYHIASTSTSLNTFDSSALSTDTATASSNIFSILKPGSDAVKAITSTVQ